jgi:hypothetical protein
VCRYCAREVKQILKAKAALRRVKASASRGPKQARPADPWHNPLIAAFYAAATASYWYALTAEDPWYAWVPVLAIGGITGISLAVVSRECSVGRFFLLGFAQPIVALIILILFGLIELSDVTPLAPELFRHALAIAGVVSGTGLLVAYGTGLTLKRPVRLRWPSVSNTELERWEGLALRIAAVVTPLISLISLLQGKPE